MVYSFQLWRHPNIRYRDAVLRLGRCELLSMLQSLSVDTDIIVEELGSASFFTFECRELSMQELSYLSGHSTLSLLCQRKGDLLFPLNVSSPDALPGDLPEILKYKGKTNPSFTRMMLNVALSLTPFAHGSTPVTVLDPLCGRGTTLFCALCMGGNAVGIDADRRDLKEASDYFSRYLKTAGMKHSLRAFSSTVGKASIPGKQFEFAPTREAYKAGKLQSLTLHEGDGALANGLLRKSPVHLLVADLPYGVQHAPQGGAHPESFPAFLARVLPAWRKALVPGGAAALSFNTLTLKADAVREALKSAGFQPLEEAPYTDLAHPVDQAVTRDVVFALVP